MKEMAEQEARSEMRRRSRRGFVALGAGALGTAAFWHWIAKSPQEGELQRPLRTAEEFNAAVSHRLLGQRALAPTFRADHAVQNVRVNGDIGIDTDLDPHYWRLQLTGVEQPERWPIYTKNVNSWSYDGDPADAGPVQDDSQAGTSMDATPPPVSNTPEPGLLLAMDDLRQLPHVEMITQLKCIEGWSEIVHWGGVRMRDFIAKYRPAANSGRYVGLMTPDQSYYVGIDRAAAENPQTLLCYEMSGRPLTPEHGAPLRLVTPLKYGIKHLKQIGRISFTDARPRDYWAENGYDWDAGL